VLPILDKIHEPGEFRPTIKEIRKWCGILNESVFDGVIPTFYNIEIKEYRGQFAACVPRVKNKNQERCIELQINPKFDNFKHFIIILVHEMIHAWEWILKGKCSHGKDFFSWKQKLKEHGIPLQEKYHKKFLDIPQ
jgi:hypothetical protein